MAPTDVGGYVVTLPSEAEWERAARHTDGREFPWGDGGQDIEQRCNMSKTGLGHTSPVGMFPNGLAECGAADMAGNVWEWTRSIKKSYPLSETDAPGEIEGQASRVLRGGAWYDVTGRARCAFRLRSGPVDRNYSLGFRLVASPFFPLNSESSEL